MSRTWVVGVVMLVCSVAMPSVSAAAPRGFGFGLEVGYPTGLTFEYRGGGVGFGDAIELSIGLDSFDDGDTYVHLVWKHYFAQLARGRTVSVPIYLGLGPFVAERSDVDLGVRFPIGLALDFRSAPVQIFFELALSLRLVDDVDLDLAPAVGFRFYFG